MVIRLRHPQAVLLHEPEQVQVILLLHSGVMGTGLKQFSVFVVNAEPQHMVLLSLVYNVQLHAGQKLYPQPLPLLEGLLGIGGKGVVVCY